MARHAHSLGTDGTFENPIRFGDEESGEAGGQRGEAMTNRFFSWDDFVDNFGAEMRIAEDVYQGMVHSGLKDWDTVSMDFDFVSDQREKLDQLRACLESRYGYAVGAPVQVEDLWEISGKTPPIPITADSLMYWALERYNAGDRAAAQWGFSAAIAAAPSDPNAWYSRATVRNELHTWKAALRDSDEAAAPGTGLFERVAQSGCPEG